MISRIERKRIFIFVAITYSITITLAVVIFFNGGLCTSCPFGLTRLANILLATNMFAPAVANIATRLITREGWSNTFLRPNLRRGWPFYLAAWLLPLMATIVGGAIYYLLFPGRFDPSMQWAQETGLEAATTDPWVVVMGRRVLDSLLYTPITMFLMLGEEFGWRAYLLPKLMPLGPRKAMVLVGVVWAVFHWPVIFMGFEYGVGYWGAPVVGLLLFMLSAIFASVVFAWVTLRSGSVWPACIAHASNNGAGWLMAIVFMGEWDPLIGPSSSGIVGMLGYAVLALLILFSPRAFAQPVPALADVASSKNPGAVEMAADRAKLGTTR
jgi:membrane protease YdiL (CAAX protease family)